MTTRSLHLCLMGTVAVALLAVGAGLVTPGAQAAMAQHGHAAQAEAQAHFDALVQQLGLTAEQRATFETMKHEWLCGAQPEASHRDGGH